jgi:hypothetical protein
VTGAGVILLSRTNHPTRPTLFIIVGHMWDNLDLWLTNNEASSL